MPAPDVLDPLRAARLYLAVCPPGADAAGRVAALAQLLTEFAAAGYLRGVADGKEATRVPQPQEVQPDGRPVRDAGHGPG